MSISKNLLVVAASLSLGALGCADAKRPAQPSAVSSGPQAPYGGPRGPRGPARGGRRLYDPSTVETVRGQVVRLEQVPSRRGAGLHVLLKNNEGALLSVHLGPSWFLEKQQFALAPGDQLEATGSRVSWDGEVYLIARELTKGQAVLALRSAEGRPLWAGSNNLGPPAGRPCAAPTNDASGPLSDAEEQALRDALDDEYLAWATYDQVIQDFGAQRPFDHIRDAEARHIEALRGLFQRYGLEVPANPWPGHVSRFIGVREACQAAVQAEINNVALYERLANSTMRKDLLTVFGNLQRASQERHKQAFERCAAGGQGRRWR